MWLSDKAYEASACFGLDWIPQTILAGTAMSIILGYDRLRSVAQIKRSISTYNAYKKTNLT